MSKIDDFNRELAELTIDCLKSFYPMIAAKHNLEKQEMNEAFAVTCATLSSTLLTRFLGMVKPEHRKMMIERIIAQAQENVHRYDNKNPV